MLYGVMRESKYPGGMIDMIFTEAETREAAVAKAKESWAALGRYDQKYTTIEAVEYERDPWDGYDTIWSSEDKEAEE